MTEDAGSRKKAEAGKSYRMNFVFGHQKISSAGSAVKFVSAGRAQGLSPFLGQRKDKPKTRNYPFLPVAHRIQLVSSTAWRGQSS
jgi:hypothetical protein